MLSRQNIFYKNKNKNELMKFIWTIPLVLLFLAFGFWINADTVSNEDAEGTGAAMTANSDEITGSSGIKIKEDMKNPENEIPNDNTAKIIAENAVLTEPSEAYYLLKEVDGVVKLFHYDEKGNETFVGATEISYDLISEQDQHMFTDGVMVKNEDELSELLQDFES